MNRTNFSSLSLKPKRLEYVKDTSAIDVHSDHDVEPINDGDGEILDDLRKLCGGGRVNDDTGKQTLNSETSKELVNQNADAATDVQIRSRFRAIKHILQSGHSTALVKAAMSPTNAIPPVKSVYVPSKNYVSYQMSEFIATLDNIRRLVPPFIGSEDHRTAPEFVRIFEKLVAPHFGNSSEMALLFREILKDNTVTSWVHSVYEHWEYESLKRRFLDIHWSCAIQSQIYKKFLLEEPAETGLTDYLDYIIYTRARLEDVKDSHTQVLNALKIRMPTELSSRLININECINISQLIEKVSKCQVEYRRISSTVGEKKPVL